MVRGWIDRDTGGIALAVADTGRGMRVVLFYRPEMESPRETPLTSPPPWGERARVRRLSVAPVWLFSRRVTTYNVTTIIRSHP